MKIEKNQIKTAYSQLTDNIRQVFDSEETSTALMNIGKKYALHIDQIGQLVTVVHYVLLGFLSPRDFPAEIKKTIGISEDVANLIIYDLNQQILSKIRQELEELSQQNPKTPDKIDEKPADNINQPTAPQIFDQKMTTVANVPKQEVAINVDTNPIKPRDPYRESI